MNAVIGVLITWAITAISLLIISKIPFVGVEIDGMGKAFGSAFVIGLLNALLWPLLALFKFGGILTALPLFILNVIIFGVAAALIQGFRLNNKIVSAILGAFLLTIINKLIRNFVVLKIFPGLAIHPTEMTTDAIAAATTFIHHIG